MIIHKQGRRCLFQIIFSHFPTTLSSFLEITHHCHYNPPNRFCAYWIGEARRPTETRRPAPTLRAIPPAAQDLAAWHCRRDGRLTPPTGLTPGTARGTRSRPSLRRVPRGRRTTGAAESRHRSAGAPCRVRAPMRRPVVRSGAPCTVRAPMRRAGQHHEIKDAQVRNWTTQRRDAPVVALVL
jgi:hypothetical protein